MEFKNLKILIDCQPRYWEDTEVNGVDDISFIETKGKGTPQIPCAEQIKDKPNSCIYSDHWTWRPVINVEEGRIENWKDGIKAIVHYKVCDAFSCIFMDDGKIIKEYDGYVPSFMSIGDEGFGDYIIMAIDEKGMIWNWLTVKNKVYKFIEEL